MLWLILIIVFLIAVLIYNKVIWPHSYWTRLGIKQTDQWYTLRKSLSRSLSMSGFVEYMYKYAPNDRYVGIYQLLKPVLMIRDPELIKQMTVKDFDHFLDHLNVLPDDPLWGRNLVALKGQEWKDMRSVLSPAFTTSKMRAMFCLMNDCADQFTKYFTKTLTNDAIETIDTKDTFSRYSNDVIATCAFGVECNSLEERTNMFYMMGKEATDFSGTWKMIKFTIFIMFPKLCKAFGVKLFSIRVENFFKTLVRDTVKIRKEQKIHRPDMIQLLMEARLEHSTKDEQSSEVIVTKEEITPDDMTAQALVFFFAGFESISVTMCFMAHELAVNVDVQERLYQEIRDTLEECNGTLTYEALMGMKYLDMVVSETLRLWPVAPNTDRVCVKPYTITKTDSESGPVHIPVDGNIWIPIYGLHRDPQYFPEPDRFDPDRFSAENRRDINPYTYLPFGVGPRNCIASRFALMEVKTVFARLLANFELVVVEKTQVPLKLSTKTIAMAPEKGFWVGLKKR